MVCSVAENQPLQRLAQDLGAGAMCHGIQRTCVRKRAVSKSVGVMGAAGAALGYCQALFAARRSPGEHTSAVMSLLRGIGAPMPESHELFLGHAGDSEISEFLANAMEPLQCRGRVPVLITSLDPADVRDRATIVSILNAKAPLIEEATMLVRIVLKSRESSCHLAALMMQMLDECERTLSLPRLWPLVQADFCEADWEHLHDALGSSWRYLNVAANPFTDRTALDIIAPQLTVAQLVVGVPHTEAKAIHVEVPDDMTVFARRDTSRYDLTAFLDALGACHTAPTIIVLGPTKPATPDSANAGRVATFLPAIHTTVSTLWSALPATTRGHLLELPA